MFISHRWGSPEEQQSNKTAGVFFDDLNLSLSGTERLWIDADFVPQIPQTSENSAQVLSLSKSALHSCNLHYLLVGKGDSLEDILQRGWVLLELAWRTVDSSQLTRILDPHGKAADFAHFTDAGDQGKDFFQYCTTWLDVDMDLIRSEASSLFANAEAPGDSFNKTIHDWLMLSEQMKRVHNLAVKERHDVSICFCRHPLC